MCIHANVCCSYLQLGYCLHLGKTPSHESAAVAFVGCIIVFPKGNFLVCTSLDA